MSTFAKDFAELMNAYNTLRARWIAELGSDTGFEEWFRQKLVGESA